MRLLVIGVLLIVSVAVSAVPTTAQSGPSLDRYLMVWSTEHKLNHARDVLAAARAYRKNCPSDLDETTFSFTLTMWAAAMSEAEARRTSLSSASMAVLNRFCK
jgi:hypothetical protein